MKKLLLATLAFFAPSAEGKLGIGACPKDVSFMPDLDMNAF